MCKANPATRVFDSPELKTPNPKGSVNVGL